VYNTRAAVMETQMEESGARVSSGRIAERPWN